jgi:hypothetical protein
MIHQNLTTLYFYSTMPLNTDVEMVTGVTDAILGILAALMAFMIWQQKKHRSPFWLLAFILLALASFLGFGVHFFLLSEFWYGLSWQILYLLLGLTIAFFALGVLDELLIDRPPVWMVLSLLGSALVFYGVTLVFPGSFLIFLAYEALALLFALGAFLYLLVRRGKKKYFYLLTAIFLTIAAAVLQTMDDLSFTLLFTFDHNGIFHLVQIASLWFFALGLLENTKPDGEGVNP